LYFQKNPDSFDEASRNDDSTKEERADTHYHLCKVLHPDTELTKLLLSNLHSKVIKHRVLEGTNCSADTFYSSQGRSDDNFRDYNSKVIDDLVEKHPDVVSIEMETFHLFDMARVSKNRIVVSANAIILAQRRSNVVLSFDELHVLEMQAGEAALNALIQYPIQEQELMNDP